MNKKNNISFPVIIELDEDNVFIVSCPVFKGCHSYGKTIDEAMSNLAEVIEMCMEEEPYNFDKNNKYIGIREINFTKTDVNKLQYA
ncbi:type II toxin-antitoxin system HicB family antitoxin [Bacteroidetes/Chlorobi group bacterium ChocPot_Mid]|jgi:predicted RNase H-like HicB family nuclease|nr:MAG: type II toxin-antitoxin system HicB family antitoxin [Bacteroidetes/Chlorobi group bacterium ChocPot_Mid]